MYTLAIENTVEVPVKFTLKEGRVNKPFAFVLLATRLSKEESESQAEGTSIKDFMLENITGWQDQRLVMGPDGKPADFSRAALDAMLSAPGVLGICWGAYLKECGAKEKN